MAIVALGPAVRLHAYVGKKRRLAKLLRRLGATIDLCFYQFLLALHESRSRQAARFIAENRNPALTVASPRQPPAKRG